MNLNDKPDEIESEIIRIVENVFAEAHIGRWPDSKWTKTIKRRLGELAVRLGYHPCSDQSKDLPNGIGEYLWDLAWFAYSDDGGMTSVPLILESEWAPYEIEVDYDFKKLLPVRAAHKVMIFQGRDHERHYERLSQIAVRSAIAPVGDRYLFLLWHWDEKKLNWHLFVKQDDTPKLAA